jgi:hypothetical protein
MPTELLLSMISPRMEQQDSYVTPFWFEKEDSEHVQKILQEYHRFFQLSPNGGKQQSNVFDFVLTF